MSLKCAICPSHCCGKSAVKPPILLPFETQFGKEDTYTETGEIFRIKKSSVTGFCKFLDENQRCTIYDKRPVECRLYPYIMQYDFEKKRVLLKLHSLCPQRTDADKPILPDEVKTVNEEFWKVFMKTPII